MIRIPYRPPIDWGALADFLALRATPGVELVQDGAYQRTISIGGVPGIVDVRPDSTGTLLAVRIEMPGYQYLMKVVERVRRIFDLGADPLRIAEDLSRDRRLKPLLDRNPGLRVPGVWDGFELAVHAVLGQQLTVIRQRRPDDWCALLENPFKPRSPTTLRALARAVHNRELTFAASMTLQEAISRICKIRGVAENTAHYIAMRALGEPDAFPLESRPEMPRMAEDWRPWRAYAALHLCSAGRKLTCKTRVAGETCR